MERWIVLSEAARLSGYHPVHLRRLLRSGEIVGRKVATVWLVDRLDLLRYLDWARQTGTKGRPRE